MFSAVVWSGRGKYAHHSTAEHADADRDEKEEDSAGAAVECICPDNEKDWTVRQAGILAWRELPRDNRSHR